MVQALSFIHSEFDHFFGAWGEANFPKNNAISTTYNSFNGIANLVQFDAEVAQYFGGDSFSFTYKTEQEMFGADVIMLEALGFFLSETQDLPGPLCELVKPVPIVHCRSPSFRYRSGKLLVSLYNKLFQTG